MKSAFATGKALKPLRSKEFHESPRVGPCLSDFVQEYAGECAEKERTAADFYG